MNTGIVSEIGRALGVEITATRSLAGGDTCDAMRAELATGETLFVKLAALENSFASEVVSLEALAAAQCIKIPTVVGHGQADNRAWLALEFLELASLDALSGAALGAGLARVHRVCSVRYGWPTDNRLGRALQRNSESDDWAQFFCEQRLGTQRTIAQTSGFSQRWLRDIDSAIAAANDALSAHKPSPALLHGDLWGGNAAAWRHNEGTSAVIYDPACYYGDYETDLAMTELFGGFPASFYQAYQAVRELSSGYPLRRDIYQLYHILNHANLFGGSYVDQARSMARRISAAMQS